MSTIKQRHTVKNADKKTYTKKVQFPINIYIALYLITGYF